MRSKSQIFLVNNLAPVKGEADNDWGLKIPQKVLQFVDNEIVKPSAIYRWKCEIYGG